ncbi:MAG TPA: PAS domain S-box protein, partial [Bacteroidia bacterium]|nr:PAS domain S-box protein [Bacteroidia bacterium]
MKIQRKVIYVFSMAFIALVSLSVYSYYNTLLGSRSAAMVSHTQDVLDNIQQVLTINADMEDEARGYELTADSKYKDECYTSSILVNKQLQKLEGLVKDNPIQEQRVNELTELLNEKIRFLYNTMETRDKSLEENYKRIQLASGNKLADKIKVKVSQMQDEENHLLAGRVAENQSAIRSSVITIMLGCSLAFAFGLWALYRLNADMNKTQIAEVAAKQSEKKYRTLIEDAADVVFRCDYAGNFTFINHRALELTGYTEDELIGKHFTFLVVPEMMENVVAFYKKQFKEMTRETILEFKVACKDGKRKWVEQTVVMIQDGNKIEGFQCIVRDVTARKRLEKNLFESNKKFQTLFDSNPYAVAVFELEPGKIVDANAAYFNMIGYTREEAIGHTAMELGVINPEERARIIEEVRKKGSLRNLEQTM